MAYEGSNGHVVDDPGRNFPITSGGLQDTIANRFTTRRHVVKTLLRPVWYD